MDTHTADFESFAAVQAGEAEIRLSEAQVVGWVAVFARRAATTGLIREDNMVAACHTFHGTADLLPHSRAFMAQHHRFRCSVFPEIDIHTANAAGHQPHQHFVFPRTLHLKALKA
ncbi:hypothetical protein V6C53_06230 [Desulfocurvibacter africanus]